MTVNFTPAPEVEALANTIIAAHHPDLVHARIEYVFNEKVPKGGGKDIWGRARKITGLSAFLADDAGEGVTPVGEEFFVIEISRPVWVVLNTAQRTALVDHELCHCTVIIDDDGETAKLRTKTHDLEEFRAVVERHGIWRPDIEAFADTLRDGAGDEIESVEPLGDEL